MIPSYTMRLCGALLIVTALTSATITPLVGLWAMHLGAVSRPGGRNVNVGAVPRLGGIAVCLAFVGGLMGALYLSEATSSAALRDLGLRPVALLIGGIGVCVVGAFDDTKRVRALHKLYVQIAAATVAYACGFRIDVVSVPFVGSVAMGTLAIPLTVAWIVGITNAINLIDGLDGLAAGVVSFVAAAYLAIALVTGALFMAITMSAILGAVLGFLVFNFNPARIIMGDSGSYFLGFVLGAMSLVEAPTRISSAVSLLVPCVALGLPIVDTLFTLVRRFLERRPIFTPDRGHIHHRLLDMGLTHRRAVLVLYGICMLLAAAAVGLSVGRAWVGGLALLVATVAVGGVLRSVGYFDYLVLARFRARLPVRRHKAPLPRSTPSVYAV